MAARKINRIILHCSATPEGRPVTVEEIRRWHLDRGWRDIGYHWVIYADGTMVAGRPEATAGAHVEGHNADSIGVCYIGGMDAEGRSPKDTRTPEQIAAILALIDAIRIRHGDHVTVHGHNEFANKACPSFDVRTELQGPRPPRPVPRPSLAGSRTLKGVSIAGVGVALEALAPMIGEVEPVREIVAEMAAILPAARELSAVSPMLSAAVVVIGLAVVVYARIDDRRRGLR